MGRLGSIFSGSHQPADPQAAVLLGGVAALSAMFVAGVQAAQVQQASLAAIAQAIRAASMFGQRRPPAGATPIAAVEPRASAEPDAGAGLQLHYGRRPTI